MRITIFDMDDLKNPHWGSGQAKVTREVFKRLDKKHSITVYASKYPGYKDYREDGITYKHIGVGTNNAKVNNLAYVFAVPFITPFIKADVIFENFTAPFSTMFTPVFTKIPVIGITSFFSAAEKGKEYKIPFYIVEKFGLRYYKYIIALNKGYLSKIKKINPKIKTKIISNGVDDIYFKLKTKENNQILFLGRIDINQKGLDLLIEAFSKIANDIKDELHIVGSGNKGDELSLKRLISESGFKNRIKFLGRKSGKDKLKLQSEAKVIVFPSRFEGQSLSALESIALGKPIICFDIPGFTWIDKNASLKVNKIDAKEYSIVLLKILKNKIKRATVGENARRLAQKYTWDNSAQYYQEFINKVI